MADVIAKFEDWQDIEEHFDRVRGHTEIAKRLFEMHQRPSEVILYLEKAEHEIALLREKVGEL